MYNDEIIKMNSTVRSLRHGLAVVPVLMSASLNVLADESGVFNGANARLDLRNFYINNNYVGDRATQGKAEEWTQSFILNARSGFTEGTVGFGADLLGIYSFKLNGGRGTGGTQLLPLHEGNDPADDFGRLAIAFKARVSETELKIGEWSPALPILSYNDGRSIPQTFQGGQVTSKELEPLTLYGGQFRANSPRNDASMERMSLNGMPQFTSDRFNFVGGQLISKNERTMIGLWYSQLENIYQQQHLQFSHSQPVGEWTFGTKVGYFHGSDDGSKVAGQLDNQTYSAQFSVARGGHTVQLGVQRVAGDSGWMRVNGTSGNALASDTWNASYDNAQERSWQVRHNYNFVALGIPGLTLMNRYTHGENAHLPGVVNGKEWGRDMELGYVVQSGPYKQLSIRWRNASMRRSYGSGSFDENDLILFYPISIL